MLAWKGLSLKLVVSYLQKTKDSILKSLHVLLEHSARFCITIHILKNQEFICVIKTSLSLYMTIN